jgi:nucleoid DNA-binding protein
MSQGHRINQDKLISMVIAKLDLFDSDKEDLVTQAINTYVEIKHNELLHGSTVRESNVGVSKIITRNSKSQFGAGKGTKTTARIKCDIDYYLKEDYLKLNNLDSSGEESNDEN